ncbi:MAG: NAD(P)H-quinone oxidoreductase [Actinobacteria bacterium]|nr:NAD(P)H-quinone oxidoreductase [Actinomycetota bacterium]
MRAVTVSAPGGPDVLTWTEVDDPIAASGEVVIRVAAAGVNRADVLQRMGNYNPPPGSPTWPGLECSGVIESVGPDVLGWSVGDEVCALLSGGGYAEKVAVPAGQVFPVPAGVDLITAAALPEVACTVWSNVFMTAGLQAGETLLVHGGSSGIGTMAIQIATALGARVAVTAGSDYKLERCAELGATILINYRSDDFVERIMAATDGHGADVILDVMGASYLARNISALAINGRIVIIGLMGGATAEINLGALLGKRGAVHATTLRARPLAEKAEIVRRTREVVWPLVEAGRVQPIVDSTFAMADATQAHVLMEASTHVGKILLTV